jgi:hypothetical protein
MALYFVRRARGRIAEPRATRWLVPMVFLFVVSVAVALVEGPAVHAMRGDTVELHPVEAAATTNADDPQLLSQVGACAYYVALHGTMPVMYGCLGPDGTATAAH